MTNENKFWELVKYINWYDITLYNNGNTGQCEDDVQKMLSSLGVPYDDMVTHMAVFKELEIRLINRLSGYSLGKYGDFRFPYQDMEEANSLKMYSLISHIIGLGKAMYYTVMRNPKFVLAFTKDPINFGMPLYSYLNSQKKTVNEPEDTSKQDDVHRFLFACTTRPNEDKYYVVAKSRDEAEQKCTKHLQCGDKFISASLVSSMETLAESNVKTIGNEAFNTQYKLIL
jgi:hypothetical protein